MSDLQTNFNVAPFFDDYNEDKQYYRILFRPGTPIQARELTQLQTMMQKQISRFGDSIYKDGTIIEGCNFTQFPSIKQIKFVDSNTRTIDFSTITLNYTDYANGYLLVSNTTGLRAAVFRAFEGAESAAPDTNRAYVVYLNTGSTGTTEFEQATEQIDVYTSVQDKSGPLNAANRIGIHYTLTSNATINALGVGYGIHVGPGIIYQKGFFQKSLPSNFIIREHYSNAAGIRVGFDTSEYIVKPAEDPSLYDNSQGSTNFSAPGAYRLKLVPEPIYYDAANTSVTPPKNFLSVLEFDQGTGQVVEAYPDPQYSVIMDTMAKRTREESGDYIVKPFQVDVTAHESNNFLFYYNASPGICYVDGYRVEYLSPRKVVAERGISTNSVSNQIITAGYGNYAYINEYAGTIDYQDLIEIDLYDAPQQTLSLNPSRTSPSGNLVGKANVRAIQYASGTKGTPNCEHILYIFNVRMNAGKVFANDVKSFYVNGVYGAVYGDFVLNSSSKITIYDSNIARAVFDTGLKGVKRLTDSSGTNDTQFVYKPIVQTTLTPTLTGSQAQFNISGPDQFNYGIGFFTDVSSQEVDFTFGADAFSTNLTTSATTSTSNSTTTTITASSGFTDSLYVGKDVVITTTGGTKYYRSVNVINSSTSLTVTPAFSAVGTLTVQEFFKKGTHMNMFGSGNTIYINSGTQATIDLIFNPNSVSIPVYGMIPIARNPASPIQKVVNKEVYVKIDCSTHPASTTGPWCLGFPDVYQISNVYFGSSYAVSNPDKQDWFDLNPGQTDTHYGMSYIVLNPKYKGNLTSSSKLLVKLAHFTPNITSSQAGFMSIDSYPIDDANTANTFAIQTAEIPVYVDQAQNRYDLRNMIDFRAYLANTAVSATVVADATINPAENKSDFTKGATGAQVIVEPDSEFIYDVEFYLPRRDSLIINKDGTLVAKNGEPAIFPKSPQINKAGLEIAEIYVPPYPSLTFKEAE